MKNSRQCFWVWRRCLHACIESAELLGFYPPDSRTQIFHRHPHFVLVFCFNKKSKRKKWNLFQILSVRFRNQDLSSAFMMFCCCSPTPRAAENAESASSAIHAIFSNLMFHNNRYRILTFCDKSTVSYCLATNRVRDAKSGKHGKHACAIFSLKLC